MGKIKEKNKRIRKIHQDLKLPDQFEDPEFGEIEQPELLLTVRDEEVYGRGFTWAALVINVT